MSVRVHERAACTAAAGGAEQPCVVLARCWDVGLSVPALPELPRPGASTLSPGISSADVQGMA